MLLKLVRLYTFYFPFERGKGRFYKLAKTLSGNSAEKMLATAKDGRKLRVSLTEWAGEGIYFLGKYEVFSTEIIGKYVNKGDVCLDVGANIGWFTTLLSKICGASGAVHAFEPVPETFEFLRENVSLNGDPPNVLINNFALGDEEKDFVIHVFENMPLGHSSLRAKPDKKSTAVPIRLVTLDSYLESNDIKRVDFVKVDVEGAEKLFLDGAGKLFAQATPPLIFMEMALSETSRFGYLPNDLIVFLKAQADYKFYALDEENKRLKEIEGFAPDDIGADVLCVPAGKRDILQNA